MLMNKLINNLLNNISRKNKKNNNKIICSKMEEKNFISKATDEESGANINVLDTNKTLIIDQFTNDAQGEDPELFEEARTIEDVFNHFKPSVDVEFADEDGSVVSETLHFKGIKDFEANGGKGNLVANSEFLSKAKSEIDNAAKIRKQIEQNKKLRDILKDPKSREEFKEYLESMLNELEENN